MDVAVLGATGEVGRTLLQVLKERDFPVDRLYPLASSRSAGTELEFGDETLEVLDVEQFDFSRVQLAFFSAGGRVSGQYVPQALEAGVSVIDNSSRFRMEPEVPLVVPEVNAEVLDELPLPLVAPCPNCSTIQLVVVLAPLARAFGLQRVDVVTFQSVSGAGHSAVEELSRHSSMMLSGQEMEPEVFGRAIAFNVLPQIGAFDSSGYTDEENKVVQETQKILELPDLIVNPTCVRVPVFYGHSEAVRVSLRQEVGVQQVRELLVGAPGLEVMDRPEHLVFPTALENGAGFDPVLVGRIRLADPDPLNPQPAAGTALNLWIVADNVRKGAAVNSVQIAELLAPRLNGGR